jgi:NADPH-dependent curcumin reductase CurA
VKQPAKYRPSPAREYAISEAISNAELILRKIDQRWPQTDRATDCRKAQIHDGRIRYREEIVDHLEKAPEAFIGMLDGLNFGKVIVRVATEGEVEVKDQAGRTSSRCHQHATGFA